MHVLLTVNAAWNIWNFRRALVENLEDLGCSFLPLEMNAKGLNPIEGIKLIRQFESVFKQEQPDVVLSFTIKNNLFGAMAARALGIPFIPNVTGLGTAFLSGRVVRMSAELLYRYAFMASQVVFFQNRDDRNLFVSRRMVHSDQARLLPGSGIDLNQFAATPMPPEKDPPVFLMVARLLRDKGVIEFVDAARKIKLCFPEVRFQLLGAVGSENRTAIDAKMVDAWVKEGVIEYLGTTTDVRPSIAAASCVVLPSYREGAPRTLIEAASMARPLIASDVPGCRAVVDNNVTGFLCEVRSADSLADAVERYLLLRPEARHAMGLVGRAKMEREYDHKLVVGKYRVAIDSLIIENGQTVQSLA